MAIKGRALYVTYVAWDVSTNTGREGDAANHTLNLVRDNVVVSLSGISISEFGGGVYGVQLTTSHMNGYVITLYGSSSTSNVAIHPVPIVTDNGALQDIIDHMPGSSSSSSSQSRSSSSSSSQSYSYSSVSLSSSSSSSGSSSSFSGSSASAFYPDNLVLWLDAAAAPFSNGQAVDHWPDMSSYRNDASQALSARRPVYYSNVQNGHPALGFDLSGAYAQSLAVPYDDSLWFQGGDFTVFVVARSLHTDEGMLLDESEYYMSISNTTHNGVAGTVSDTQTDSPAGQWHVTTMMRSTVGGLTSVLVQVDGTGSAGTPAFEPTSVGNNGISIGARRVTYTAPFRGYIAEVMIYNAALSSVPRAAVTAYLTSKYAL